MTIDPVKIPQNVYVEDRIFGPISLRQIIICLLTGGISYMLSSIFAAAGATTILTRILGLLPFILGTAFAFVKINGITLTRFCLLMIERMDKPSVRLWSPRRGIFISIGSARIKSAEEIAKETRLEAAQRREQEKRRRIEELSGVLDSAPSAAVEKERLIAEREEAEAKSQLPVDRSRVKAEPLKDNENTDTLTLQTSPSMVRDITPPTA